MILVKGVLITGENNEKLKCKIVHNVGKNSHFIFYAFCVGIRCVQQTEAAEKMNGVKFLWLRIKNRHPQTSQHSAERNLQRVVESVLPVASLYGVDIANIDPEWFRDKTTR